MAPLWSFTQEPSDFAMVVLGITILAVIGGAALWRFFGALNAVLAFFFTTVCILQRVIIGGTEADLHRSGIAGFEPRIMTYTPTLLMIALIAIFGKRQSFVALWIPLGIFLALGMIFVWVGTGEEWAGTVHFAEGVCGWTAGCYASSYVNRDLASSRTLARWIIGIVIVQAGIGVLQYFGIPVFPTNAATSELVGDRINGTLGHPTTLGKVVVLLSVISLPLTRSIDRKTARLASLSILIGLLLLIMSGGRANFFAVIVMLLTWVVLLPKTVSFGLKLLVPASVGIAIVASMGVWQARFEEDPEGLTRQHFNVVALTQMQRSPIAGTGPNTYVTAVGPHDFLTSQGWPVHNTVLFAIVEIGLVGSLFLFSPMVIVAIKAFMGMRDDSPAGDFARGYIVSIPAIALIALTGWGMLSDVLPLWLFVLGFCLEQMDRGRKSTPKRDVRSMPFKHETGMISGSGGIRE